MTETERAILGTLLQNNKLFHENWIQEFQFLSGNAKQYFRGIRDLIGRGAQADIVTLTLQIPGKAGEISALTSLGLLGKRSYELACQRQVQEWQKASLKTAIAEAEQMLTESSPMAVEGAMTHLQSSLTALSNGSSTDDIVKYADALFAEINSIEERRKRGGEIPGITTGFPGLDACTLGLNPGRLYIIGARPSVGKSAIALKMSLAAASGGHAAGIITLESIVSEYTQRSIATMAKIDSRQISSGFNLTRQDLERMFGAINGDLPIWLYDQSSDLDRICAIIRKMVMVNGVKVVYIDYIQLVEKTGRLTKHEKVMMASTAFKQLAKQLGIPIVVLAQLDREADNRPPRMSDIQWASQIEQDADVMLLLERLKETLPAKDGRKPDDDWIRLHIAKNRDGSRGIEIDLRYTPRYLRFGEIEEEQWGRK